jgi:hypothetical protein
MNRFNILHALPLRHSSVYGTCVNRMEILRRTVCSGVADHVRPHPLVAPFPYCSYTLIL